MAFYFPEITGSAEGKELYVQIKRRAFLIYKKIRGEASEKSDEKQIEDYFYSLIKPKDFFGPEGAEAQYEKQFQRTCTVMAQHVSRNPKKMTALEYLQTLEELKEQNKKQTSAIKSRGK